MTKYPIGLQNFQGLREDGYVYVDKTAFVYQLAQSGKYYFLSRPRRFGKSLFLSTLEAYYLGKKELFKGLALERLEKDWKVYPVLHLDLNAAKYTDSEALESILDGHFRYFEETYGTTPNGLSLSERFKVIIRHAYEKTGQKVVILVDEYDKPLLQAIGNKALQDEYRAMLKSVYGVAKTMDGYIQMAFFTGLTKIQVDSLSGDLNNITNISLDNCFAELCGFTKEEHKTTAPKKSGRFSFRQPETIIRLSGLSLASQGFPSGRQALRGRRGCCVQCFH
ncbi:MAG: AAA family ATPase [Bacteroidales bacterium]|nr:AAA family ATPase [Bacteroidales bacterium]